MYNSGLRGKRAPDGYGTVDPQSGFNQASYPVPSITSYSVSGVDDQALDPAGGQTVIINGNGFVTGMTVLVGGTSIGAVTYLSPKQLSFVSAASSPGSFTLTVAAPTGGAAILIPGIIYSGVPTWTTSAGNIGQFYETTPVSTAVIATADSSITYSLASGTLPTGSTLYANGVISGTAPVDGSSTTYSFAVTATDAELQDTTRSFTITINTDVVTWSSPANGTEYTVLGNSPIANVTLSATSAAGYSVSYAANTLPTGISLSGNVISGTPTTEQTVSTLLTATAATTGRSATETISWSVILGDTYFYDVTLLVAAATTTVTPFIADASTNNLLLTVAGEAKATKSTPYSGEYYSNLFTASTDSFTTPGNAAFGFGTGDYTVEFWVNFTTNVAGTRQDLVWWSNGSNDRGGLLLNFTSGTLSYYIAPTVAVAISYTWAPVPGIWYHVALVRISGSTKLYVNGTQGGSTYSDTKNYSTLNIITVGKDSGAASSYMNASMSNLRIAKGVGVYTGTFTPPTSPLEATQSSGTNISAITSGQTSLLTCQSNRFVDNSTNAFTITPAGTPKVTPNTPFAASSSYATYGSMYNINTSAYISSSLTSGQAFGSGDFTVEAWLYATATAHNISVPTTTTNTWALLTFSNTVYWQFNGGNPAGMNGGTVRLNAWSHIAISRASGTIKGFLNGVQIFSTADANNYTGTPLRPIGTGTGGTAGQYIADFRVVNGTGIYTTAFTPPTAPLTAVANTQILTCQYNGGANNNGIIDNDIYNNVITRNGNATQGTFSPFSNTGWSNYFNGSSYLTATIASQNLLAANTTIEAWVYRTSAASQQCIVLVASSFTFALETNGQLRIDDTVNAGSVFNSSGTVPLNTWTNVAIVRSSNTFTFYINGSASGTNSSVYTYYTNSGTALRIGYTGSTWPYIGYLSNIRCSNVARSISLPTSPYSSDANTIVLTAQSNRFKDNSSSNYTISVTGTPTVQAFSPFNPTVAWSPTTNGGSMYLDGTGDYLTLASNPILAVGPTDFTVEAWIYPTTTTQFTVVYLTSTFQFFVTNGALYWNDGAQTSGGTIVLNAWQHIAVSRSGTTLRGFINGVQVITTTSSVSLTQSTNYIGYNGGTAGQGYVSDVRLTKGTAIYTGAFTPPTAPLTSYSTANPSTLLLNFTNGAILDAHATNDIETVGTTQLAPQTPYTGSYRSWYFDGATGKGVIKSNPGLYLNGDFTIECWVYWSGTATSYQNFIGSNSASFTGNASFFRVWGSNAGGTLGAKVGIGNPTHDATSSVYSTNSLSTNQWNYVTATRASGIIRVFINGNLERTGSSDVSVYDFSDNGTVVGDSPWDGASGWFSGYITDLRVTNGIARYTTNFTPPATALLPY